MSQEILETYVEELLEERMKMRRSYHSCGGDFISFPLFFKSPNHLGDNEDTRCKSSFTRLF